MSIINWMFTLMILLISVVAVHGSHFVGGSISYKVVGSNGSKLIVRVTQSYTYLYSKIYCDNNYIANQWNLVFTGFGDATATLNCTASCATNGGYTPIPVASKCTDYSVGMAITVGQRTDDVPIDNGSYFVIAYQGTYFRNLTLPGSGGTNFGWSLSCLINLIVRPDGTYNTPPKATMISPIYIPVGVQQKISIPTIDADNDNVRCRFANGAQECADICPPSSLPSGTSISTDCTLTITGAAVGDWYAVAIQVEDFANSTTTTPYSSVPVQFLVHVYAQPNCTQRPYLYGPSPDGTCIGVEVGVPYTLTLYTENYCTSYNVTMVDIATQSFPIVIKTPIAQNSSTLSYVILTWTPTANEVGSQVFCSVGVDSTSVQTNQYCLTFTVGNGTLGTCPGVEITSTEEMTTEAPTTEPATTTTTAQNTTAALTEVTTVVVTVIIIPICCCCYCSLYCCMRYCGAVEVEQEKKPVTTYTIEGADINKDLSLIGKNYQLNESDDTHNGPSIDTSFITLRDTTLDTESIPSIFVLPMDNNDDLSSSSTHNNIPSTLDTTFPNTDGYRMMMHQDPFPLSSSIVKNAQAVPNPTGNNSYGVQTTSYNHYPPPQFSTQISTLSAPAAIRSNIYRDNIQQPIDSLHLASLPQSPLSSSLNLRVNSDSPKPNVRTAFRPWTKHPRWVLRLSQPKEVHTPSLPRSRPSSGEQPKNNLNSSTRSTVSGRSTLSARSTLSTRSTSTIPRYAFVDE